jgi:hypothetical protein
MELVKQKQPQKKLKNKNQLCLLTNVFRHIFIISLSSLMNFAVFSEMRKKYSLQLGGEKSLKA